MQEQQYLITVFGKEAKRTFTITYRSGFLFALQLSETDEWTASAISWTLNFLRSQWSEEELQKNQADTSSLVRFRADKVEQDLSFDAFWDLYEHKVGNKARAMKLWSNLPKMDKARCFVGIRQYKFWLSHHPNVEKLYAETFLHQRRWENEYKL
jgi:hypothetical protein